MYEDDYSAAVDFFTNIFTPEDVLHLDLLINKIFKAPPPARRYLERHCRNPRELGEFFKDNDYLFFFENKKVALFDEQHIKDSELAVEFFKDKLQRCGRPVEFMELKIKHIELAPERVCFFISNFYPGKEIKKFFKSRPDVFVLHEDHTVFLVEVDSVEFYRKKLLAMKGTKQHFLKFRGHIGQADPHVQTYLNRHFNGDEFQDFLLKNSKVFILDENGLVSLVPTK